MTKEHKKLYKAGKNWIVATLTATTITLLGGIGAYTVHADTTIESSQDVQTTSVNQTNQVNNTNNSVTLNNNQPVAVQSSQTAQNDQSVKGNQTNQTVPSSATAAADTSNSDSLDSNIYGTVNVKDWDYQNDSNTFNLTSYHGQDTRHIIVPNLNDFDNAGVKIGNATGVGISSKLAKSLASQSLAFAISKTSGKYSDKVTATDNDWSSVFSNTGLINADVSNLDTRNITNMGCLFDDSPELKTVGDLSHWDTSNVTDMSDMFEGSSASVSGLNTWNTRKTTNMSGMFAFSSLPYKIVAANELSIVPNQVTLKDNTGKVLAIIDTPTIYDSNKSVRSTIDGIVQAEIDKLNKLNHTSYETPKIISGGDDDYSIANATYVVSQSKTGLINYVDQDGKVVKTDQVSGKVGDKVDVKLSLPDGYELANKDEQVPSTITVGDDGIKTININIKKIPVIKTGTINYIDPDGKVVKTDQVSGKVGDKVDVKISLPDGYELANKDEHIPSVITVTENGIGTINVNVKKINTTLANNEVPSDSTTISNNVNANYGYLDSYKLTENNQGQAQLIASGWHATGTSNSDRYRYMIVFDNTLGHEIARQKLVPQVRSDVQRAYSNVDNSLYSGFNVTIDIPNSCINHSLRLVSRYSNDPNNGEGARVDYWFNPLALNEGNQAYLDGLSSNGNTLTVTGWHATNQAAGRPYHYIIAWDQNLGHEIARQKVTAVSRPDVANAYSTVANAVNSGFSVKFNLTPQFFNDNIQFISRWTDDAAGNGNAVDYWFKAMNRENRANLDSVTLSNGQVQVAGWHATDLSQLEPNHYLIVFDNTTGQQVASEKVDLQSSQDVKNVFGDIQTADHSRFNYTFNSLHLIPGHNYSLVSRYSADATGNGNNGAHTDSWLNMGTFQQSAYSIDHVALNRRHMTVQGWVANDNAMTRPYAYAILLQNGHEIGRQRLNLSERADVAKVYPQIYRSQYSGFNANFDLPTLSTAGLQLVLRFTDDPAGNGNSSDQWIKLNKFSLAD